MLVLDGPHFAVARRAGVASDHVLSREEWVGRHPGQPWEDYLAGQLARFRRDDATGHVVALPPEGSAALDPAEFAEGLRPPARRWHGPAGLGPGRRARGAPGRPGVGVSHRGPAGMTVSRPRRGIG